MTRLLVLALALVAQGLTADWPQVLGPGRNGVYSGPPLSEAWGANGPRVVWRRSIGQGLSGPVVAGNRVILFHRVADREIVEAIDAVSGKTQWQYGYPTSYRDDFGFDEGPRAVPVVANGVVYTFGAEGQLHAVDLASGKQIWSVDTQRRFSVPKGFFGAAGSPLVEDGRVIANIGGAKAGIVAFEAKTGKVLWTATDDAASYSSGIGVTIAGRRYAVFLTRNGLAGLDPGDGQVRFQRPWRARQAASVNAATPVINGDMIFLSAEYGPGAGVLRFDGTKLTEVWASDEALSSHYATSVYAAGDGRVSPHRCREDLGARDRRESIGRRAREDQLTILPEDQQPVAGQRDASGAESILAPADFAGLEFHCAETLAELLPSVKTVKISARIHAGRVVIREHFV